MIAAFDTSVLVAAVVGDHVHHARATPWLEAVQRGRLRARAKTAFRPVPAYGIMNGTMPYEATIDSAGRLVIPKPLRKRLGLKAGETLSIEERPDAIVVRPRRPGPRLREESGLLVLVTDGPVDVPDHREIYDERLDQLAGR